MKKRIARIDALDVIGRSVRDEVVTNFLKAHAIAPPKDAEMRYGRIEVDAHLENDDLGILMSLLIKDRYDQANAEPGRGEALTDHSWIVDCIDLGAGYPYPLPFGLALGDHVDAIVKAIGAPPIETIAGGKNDYHEGQWFLVGNVRVLVALDARRKLLWLRLIPLDRDTARTRRGRKQQVIDANNAGAIAKAARKRPTTSWKKRRIQGDTGFTATNLVDADRMIDAFVEGVEGATRRGSSNGIRAATKKIVVGFNTLNKKQPRPSMIATMEREELCAFIDAVVRATGYQIAKDEDITAEWRREW